MAGLGAMMFGGVDDERIVLNESSVWSGSPQDADRPDAYKVLPEIRRLLLEGKNPEAETLVNSNFTCKGPGSSGGTGDNQYGAIRCWEILHLSFTKRHQCARSTNYSRRLDLDEAVARMDIHSRRVKFTPEMFASARGPRPFAGEVGIDQRLRLRIFAFQQ